MNAFAKTCRTDFAFLVGTYGFERTITEGDRYSSASFARPDALIGVYAEAGDKPWVTVKVGRRYFGLHKAIRQIDPAYEKRQPESGETAMLVHYARFLKKHFRTILGPLPRKPPPPAPPKKRRANKAGALDFLATLPGWKTASSRTFATKMTTLIYYDGQGVRLTLDLVDGKTLERVRIYCKTKESDLDDAIRVLAPELNESRPEEQKSRLVYYAEFLRHRGAALLAGKRSAWGKLR